MHKSLYVLATAAVLSWACSTSQAMPITGGAMRDAIDETNLVEKTAVYIVRAIVIASISMAGTAPAGIAAATHFGEVLGGVASTDGRVGTMVLQHGALGVV